MFRDDGLKLTIAKYYTPNDRCIDGTGIEPDVEVESNNTFYRRINFDSDLNLDDDAQLLKGVEILKSKIGSN